jgi:glycerol-3-phosphate dehydrogenase (NAD(P)+)
MSVDNPIRTAVIGAGSFGTCLAILLAEHRHLVRLWARDAAVADAIGRHRRNPRYLTEFRLPDAVRATTSLEEALEDAEIVLSVVPSHAVREVWTKAGDLLDAHALVVSGSKGIEVGTGKLVSQVLAEVLPAGARERLVVVSGPSFARELAERRPTGLTVASTSEPFAIAVQSLLSSPLLRCYSSTDVLGVELGGALKNVIAIAVGIADGLELGLNARASVITRGLAEITRLGTRLGADPLTFLGLSGLGDLVLTCTGDLSRNRRVGVELGRGRRLDEVLAGLHEVAEGVRTARSARELAAAHGVPMPITDAVHAVLHEGRDPRQAVHDMLGRELRSELE